MFKEGQKLPRVSEFTHGKYFYRKNANTCYIYDNEDFFNKRDINFIARLDRFSHSFTIYSHMGSYFDLRDGSIKFSPPNSAQLTVIEDESDFFNKMVEDESLFFEYKALIVLLQSLNELEKNSSISFFVGTNA